MFPRKLYQILCETDPAIITWDEDGTSWHIANYEEYIEGVMPQYYRHNKLTSFQRQLNLYGEQGRQRGRIWIESYASGPGARVPLSPSFRERSRLTLSG